MDAIKLEGGAPSRISAAKAIVEAGIAVMGHVGLTPQAISVLGGFRPQGKTVDSAIKVPSLFLQADWLLACIISCVFTYILFHVILLVCVGCRDSTCVAGGWLLLSCVGVCASSGGSSCNISIENPNHRHRCWAILQWAGTIIRHALSIHLFCSLIFKNHNFVGCIYSIYVSIFSPHAQSMLDFFLCEKVAVYVWL